jgi:hypothetical protein
MYATTGFTANTRRATCIALSALIVAVELICLMAGTRLAYDRRASTMSEAQYARTASLPDLPSLHR